MPSSNPVVVFAKKVPVVTMIPKLHLTISEYSHMVASGAFEAIHRKVELIRGELVEINPAGPVHDDYIAYFPEWSLHCTTGFNIQIRAQSGLSLPAPSAELNVADVSGAS